MTYGHFNDVRQRTASDQILLDKACNVAINPKYGGLEHWTASMINECFETKFC